jgi:hypothetical protein
MRRRRRRKRRRKRRRRISERVLKPGQVIDCHPLLACTVL